MAWGQETLLVATRAYDVVELTSERFRKNDSLIFESDTDLLMIEEWIRNIEKKI